DVLPAHAGDVDDGNALGAGGLAFAVVGAAAKAFDVHLVHHAEDATFPFGMALGQEGELRNLGPGKESGRGVGAGCDACAAADAGRCVHGLFGNVLGDGNGVGVRGRAGVDRDITAGGDDPVQSRAVDDQVFDDRKG